MRTKTISRSKTKVIIKVIVVILISVLFGSIAWAFVPISSKEKVKKSLMRNFKLEQKITLKSETCYLSVDGRPIKLKSANSEHCQNYFIASEYVNREDFYRLLYTSKEERFTRDDILDSDKIKVFWINQRGRADTYRSMKRNIFTSDKCENINYFGINLFCFNEVEVKFEGRLLNLKENKLSYIIPYLTILKYTSNELVMNGLLGREVYPFEFVKNESTSFYDGTNPDLYDKSHEEIGCGGGANYRKEENRSYICEEGMMDFDLPITALNKGIGSAAIIYHEVNHKFDEGHLCSHEEDYEYSLGERFKGETSGGREIIYESECNCSAADSIAQRDRDFGSTYGAHIQYLLSISENGILGCEEKLEAFITAEKEMRAKLCQYPEIPSHRFSEPVCE